MIILALGSNVGDRLAHLQEAYNLLKPLFSNLRVSTIYESAAMLPDNATADMDMPFLNMAIAGDCKLKADELHAKVKSIESTVGRVKRGFWGPREIDIDIIAMYEEVIETADLKIPHPGILKRDFVLLPVADVAPDWRFPVEGIYQGKSIVEIASLLSIKAHVGLYDSGLKLHE